MGFELRLERDTRLVPVAGCGGGSEVTAGLGTSFKCVDIEMNMSFVHPFNKHLLKHLFCAKRLSENGSDVLLRSLRAGRGRHASRESAR